jgi:hypothetical protein
VRTTDCRSSALLIFRRRLSTVSLKTGPRLPPRPFLRAPGWSRQQLPSWPWSRMPAWTQVGLGLSGRFRLWLSLGSRLWLERSERLAGDFNDCGTILIAQLSSTFESRGRDVRCSFLDGVLSVQLPIQRYAVEELGGQRVQDGDLRGSACLRQARMRRPCSMLLGVSSSSRAPNRARSRVPRTGRT